MKSNSNRAANHDQRVGFSRVFQGFLQSLWVLAAVLELERINREDLLADFIAPLAIQKRIQACARANPVVMAACGADILVLFQVGLVEHALATGAFDP